MKKVSTKKALIASVLSMLVCVSMLIGSTFAWFTDSASTGVNVIKAGSLKVELLKGDADEALDGELKWVKADGHEDEEVLWEPGATYALQSFRIKNGGNLALKYKVAVNGLTGSAKLLEAIDFTVSVEGDETVSTITALDGYEGKLSAKAVTGKITISGTMREDAGNEYMDEEISGISIAVYATQAAEEYDSNGNDYDEDAKLPVTVSGIKKEYGTDGLKMPAGVIVEKDADATNGHFVITLQDKEAFLYFTQVFNRKEALAARTEALNNGTATKYEGESVHNSLNIWYYENAVTLKMGCDIDLEGSVVSPFTFGGIYFDGDGHVIKNAKLVATSGDVGFFGRGVTLRNVVLDNINVSAVGCDCAGVAMGSTNTNISNVTVKNSSVVGAKYTGAIVGYNYGSVTDCVVEKTNVSGQYKVGGIIGYICEEAGKHVSVTGNKLTEVTVAGENLWSGKTSFVIGKVVGNWNAIEGTCKNNAFSGTTVATDDIGEVEARSVDGLVR